MIEPTGVFGVELGLPGRLRLVARPRAGGRPHCSGRVKVEAIGSPHGARARTAITEDKVRADTVIITSGEVPDTRLAVALRSAGVPVRTIGDCREVRHLEGANRDALDAALAIG